MLSRSAAMTKQTVVNKEVTKYFIFQLLFFPFRPPKIAFPITASDDSKITKRVLGWHANRASDGGAGIVSLFYFYLATRITI